MILNFLVNYFNQYYESETFISGLIQLCILKKINIFMEMKQMEDLQISEAELADNACDLPHT